MEQSPSQDELTVMHQFDRLCQLALDGEAANYYRHMEYQRNHEVNFSEMKEKELEVPGYDIEVKDTLLVEALQALTEKKRNVVLLSYFLEMTDAEIAREMKLVHSTIREHRTRSLELLKKLMEENMDGAEE